MKTESDQQSAVSTQPNRKRPFGLVLNADC
jgi:hypothetical protein